ncbi:hypothetical protein VNO80_04765 [Phaseolus coccineus]|uniref:Uncharacterized protein n=1 Tax=Phaseolus coccineus TaxID=3886 RepID=A0AAN9RRY5_PHACN
MLETAEGYGRHAENRIKMIMDMSTRTTNREKKELRKKRNYEKTAKAVATDAFTKQGLRDLNFPSGANSFCQLFQKSVKSSMQVPSWRAYL